jgi:hypothetical protein
VALSLLTLHSRDDRAHHAARSNFGSLGYGSSSSLLNFVCHLRGLRFGVFQPDGIRESSMRVHRSFGIAILLLCLAACGARLSQENFDKIHEGMSQKEVREILGEPVDASGASLLGFSSGEAVWKDDKTTITVHFLNDKVITKQMSRTEKKDSSQKEEGRS